MSDDSLYRMAEQRADEKIGFYKHLYSFIGVNILLFVVNVFTSWQSGEWGNWWFYWVTLFWGIGLVIHFLRVFVFNNKLDDNRDKMIEKEMEKLRK